LSGAEISPVLGAFDEEDECRSDATGGACALNALQRLGARKAASAADYELFEPDFTIYPVETTVKDIEDMDAAEEEQMPEPQAALQFVPGVDKVVVKDCHLGTACPHGETCVVKADKTYSQCVSCHRDEFPKECQKLDDYMRFAAVHTCKQTCEDTMCYNNKWCMHPHKCVFDKEMHWGQCVNCHKNDKFWKYSCSSKPKSFLEAAHHVCHKKCHA